MGRCGYRRGGKGEGVRVSEIDCCGACGVGEGRRERERERERARESQSLLLIAAVNCWWVGMDLGWEEGEMFSGPIDTDPPREGDTSECN